MATETHILTEVSSKRKLSSEIRLTALLDPIRTLRSHLRCQHENMIIETNIIIAEILLIGNRVSSVVSVDEYAFYSVKMLWCMAEAVAESVRSSAEGGAYSLMHAAPGSQYDESVMILDSPPLVGRLGLTIGMDICTTSLGLDRVSEEPRVVLKKVKVAHWHPH